MVLRRISLLILVATLTTSCKGVSPWHDEPVPIHPIAKYEYEIGLGYGFLGKGIKVTVDDHEVLSIYGTDEIEQHGQLLGTKMLASGVSSKKDVIIRVIVDSSQQYEQWIDLSSGKFVHIYQEPTGINIYNTSLLVLE
jgi:hypothetical protein